ncbi:hypothetical protein AB0N17_00170 [Streptomyces sp. NPDC051133]|uniref:hypothetical protein n=1 Tax=Streptomyces sp. NPDC051133 TaxID=3155521 RepID=UPI00341C825D
MPTSPARFRDPRSTEYDFLDSILVRCPRCDRVARVQRQPHSAEPRPFAPRRLVCRSCGLARVWAGRGIGPWSGSSGPAADAYFGVRLWLRRETRHGRLWAYDLAHLDLIRRFAGATLRERAPWYDTGQKLTLVARLPAWVTSAKNRDEVLRGVDRLRRSVLTGS